jgi:heme exporter protein B
MLFWRATLAILWKDLLLEVRTKDIITSLVVFAILVVVIFNFAFPPIPRVVALVTPGILWVAFTFAGILGLNRVFVLEKDRGNLEGLMLAPVGRDAIYFGKMMGSFLFMLIVETLILPIFTVLFNVPLWNVEFLLMMLLATLGFAAVGTVFSAIAINTRSREVMLPVLFFPIVLPVVISAVQMTGMSLQGDSWSTMFRWLQLVIAFDIIFLVVSSLTFEYVLEE